MFGARPTFGGSSTFGNTFGTTTNSSTFGTSSFGRPAFGTPATSSSTLFGTNTAGGNTGFGQSQPSGGGLFGSTNTQSTGFGNNTTTSSTFGTSGGTMFGTNNQTTGLFGSGGSAFNTNQSATRPFSFGTPTSSGTSGTGLFGSNTNTSGGTLFNSTLGNQTTGTTIKFNPVTSSDTMNRGGVSSNIQTKIEVITAMKEYETKSVEELRVEDYVAGRKGSTNQTTSGFGFGGNKFGGTTQNTTPLFGQTSNTSSNLFGAKPQENKTTFGSGTGFSFNQPSSAPSFGFNQTNTQAASPFGTTGFNFGNTSTPNASPFGDNKLNFGAAGTSASTGLFGAANKPTFGVSGTTGNTSVFGKAAPFSSVGFGTSAAPTVGATNTFTGTGLFAQNAAKPAFSFGTSTPGGGFGAAPTGFGSGGGLFAQNATQNKPGTLSFGGGLPFGTTPSTGFGFNQNSGGLLGSNTSGGFGVNQNTGLNTSTTGFGTNFNSGFGLNNLQGNQQNMSSAVNNNNLNNLIKALTHNPFGNSSLLKSSSALTGKADELLNSITSGDGSTEGGKSDISKRPHYILPSSISIANVAKPIGINRLSNGSAKNDPSVNMLFAGLDETSDFNSDDPFKPKFFPRVKKLGLKVFKNMKSNEPTNNIKNISITRKMPFNDTLGEFNDTVAEFNLPKQQKSLDADSDFEANKENAGLSLLDSSRYDSPLPALNESNMEPHPSGMKLSRSGYYTLPSMEDLKEMTDENGKCVVENFTVGRYDYGNVCFLGITDIHGLDLDSIVQIVRKEVEVYPEGMQKPPIGEELNKPALVTLDCVWPVDKTSREVIREEDRLVDMKWTEYLEHHCLKMDASFVEYRLETGSWVFKVKHFSKYGLQEDEKEQLPANEIQKTTEQQQNILEKPIASTSFVHVTSNLNQSLNVTPVIAGSITKKTNGPPALGLVTTPPGLSFSRPSEDLVFTPPTRKVYLDDASLPSEGIANEPEECASICPLSPSAERLTVASKISQSAIQNKKSHLFFDDALESSPERGKKRQIFQSLNSPVMPENDDHGYMIGSTKKLILTQKIVTGERNLQHDDPSIRERVVSKPDITIRPELYCDLVPELTMSDERQNLVTEREAKTEYPLIPCGKTINQSGRQHPQHQQEKINRENSLALHLSTCISDSAAFMGRSFRVGWGPGLTFVHGGTPLNHNMLMGSRQQTQKTPDDDNALKSFLFTGTTSQAKVAEVSTKEQFPLLIEKLNLVQECNQNDEPSEKEINPILKNYMEIILEHCTHNDDDFPQFVPNSGIDLLHGLAVQQEECQSRLSTIFHLCVALWGKLRFYSPDIDGGSVYAEAQYRKEAISQWLENVSSDLVSIEVERSLERTDKDGYLDAVFSHMSVRQISKACSIAQKNGDYHLALLLSQVCLGDETPRQIVKHQLEAWVESGAENYISDSRMSLYSLIAGLPTHRGSQKRINTCLGLDWKRSLGLHYWYFKPATSTIGEGLEMYEEAAGLGDCGEEKYCEEPRPYYAFESLQNLQVNYDICYHLIKLFVDPTHKLEVILENSTITADPLDFSGSWLLWCVLHSLGFTSISETKANQLHLSFASVLESQGHWRWAAFVLLFIKARHCREKELEALLSRQLLIESHIDDDDYFEKESFLIGRLKIPIHRLQRLKAYRARFLKLNDEEAWYLLMDNDFNKAHKLILDSIAPNAVINEDHRYLKTFLYKLKGAQSQIIDWASGGEIYCAYIEILEQIEQLKVTGETTGREVERLRPKLLSLCSKLNNIKCLNAVHRVAVSEMSRVAVSVLRAILGTDPDSARVLAQQVASLPLTHECALEELNHITHQYLTYTIMETW